MAKGSDAKVKSANVISNGRGCLGEPQVTATWLGEFGTVMTANEPGATVGGIGELVSVQIMPNPHHEVERVLSGQMRHFKPSHG